MPKKCLLIFLKKFKRCLEPLLMPANHILTTLCVTVWNVEMAPTVVLWLLKKTGIYGKTWPMIFLMMTKTVEKTLERKWNENKSLQKNIAITVANSLTLRLEQWVQVVWKTRLTICLRSFLGKYAKKWARPSWTIWLQRNHITKTAKKFWSAVKPIERDQWNKNGIETETKVIWRGEEGDCCVYYRGLTVLYIWVHVDKNKI